MEIPTGSADSDTNRDSPSSTNQPTGVLGNMEREMPSTAELIADFFIKAMAHNKDDVTSDDRLNIPCSQSSSTGSLDRMDTPSDSSGPEEMISSMLTESESESDTLIDNSKETTSDDLGISFGFFDDDNDCSDGKDHGPDSGDVSTSNDVGDVSTTNDVGDVYTTNDVGDVSTTNDVEDVSTTNDVGDVYTTNDVGDVSTTNDVGDVSTTNDVGDVSAPNDVGDVSTTNDVGDVSTTNDVGDVCTPNDVEDVSTTNDVGDVSTTNDVGDVSTTNDVGDDSTTNDVGDVSTTNDVGDFSAPNGVGDVSTSNDVEHDNFVLCRVKDNHHTTSRDSNTSFGFFEDCDFSDTNENVDIYASSLDNIETASSSTSEESELESDTLVDYSNVNNCTEPSSRDMGLSFDFFYAYNCGDDLDHGPDSSDDSISKGDNFILCAINDDHCTTNPFVSPKDESQSKPISKPSSSIHIRKISHGASKKENSPSTATTTSINKVHSTRPTKRLSLRDLHTLPTEGKKETSSIDIRKIPHGPVKKDNPTTTNTPTTTSINRDHPTAPIKPKSSKLLHSLRTQGKKGTKVAAKVSKSTNKEQNSEQENLLFWFDSFPDYLEKENFQQYYHDRHLYPCSHGFDPQMCYCQSPWRYQRTTTVEYSTQFPSPPSNRASESLLSHPTQEKKGTKNDATVQYREGVVKVTAL